MTTETNDLKQKAGRRRCILDAQDVVVSQLRALGNISLPVDVSPAVHSIAVAARHLTEANARLGRDLEDLLG